MPVQYDCHHEELIQEHTLQITQLEKEVEFKKEKIDKLQDSIEKMDTKLDKIIEQSEQKDNDIDKRVTSLETTVKVLKWVTGLLFGSGVIFAIITQLK